MLFKINRLQPSSPPPHKNSGSVLSNPALLSDSATRITTGDTTLPRVSSINPANFASQVSVSSNIVITFSETVAAGSGYFLIRSQALGDSHFIDATDTAQVSFNGSTVTINPTDNLRPNGDYEVILSDGVVNDLSGNAFARGSNFYPYQFRTVSDVAPPQILSITPADAATNVNLGANIVIRFSEPVFGRAGAITLQTGSPIYGQGVIVETFHTQDTTRVRVNGDTLTLDPSAELRPDTQYFVVVQNGAVQDAAGNLNAEQTGHDFRTVVLSDDVGNGTGTTATLAIGSVLDRRLHIASDVDFYRVQLTAGQAVRFEMKGSDSALGSLRDPYLTLRDATGNQVLAFDDDSGKGWDARLSYLPSTSGTFYLVASSTYNASSGSYRISMSALTDEAGTTAANSRPLALGATLSGALQTRGDVDWLRFDLVAGQTYRFNVTGVADWEQTLDPAIRLIGTDGITQVAGQQDIGSSTEANIAYTAARSGSYYLAVSATVAGTTGNYRVQASTVIDDHGGMASNATALAINSTLAGNIQFSGDRDMFAVNLFAGKNYEFSVAGTPTLPSLQAPALTLRDLNGNGLLASQSGGISPTIRFTPTQNGRYYLGVEDSSSIATGGQYTVRTRLLADDFSNTTLTIGRLATTAPVNGRIEAAGDLDWFKVSLTAGNSYTFDLKGAPSGAGTLADPRIAGIHDAAGILIPQTANDDFGGSRESRVSFVAQTSGVYFVSAGGFASNIGSYQLRMTETVNTDLPASVLTPQTLAVGNSYRGLVSPAGDVDWIRVNLRTGTTYDINLTGDTTANDPLSDPVIMGVYNNSGQLIPGTFNDDFGSSLNARVTFTPNQGSAGTLATYYIAASGYGSRIGAYELRVSANTNTVDLEGDTPQSAVQATANGQTGGMINHARDIDWFKVVLQAGQYYRIGALGSDSGAGTLADPRIAAILQPNGAAITGAGNEDAPNTSDAQSIIRAETTGTYFVSVTSSSEGIGSYRVGVSALASVTDVLPNGSTQGSLSVAQALTQYIETPGDIDWFRLNLTGGKNYTITQQGTAAPTFSLSDPYILGVYDGMGRVVQGTTADGGGVGRHAQTTFTAATTGQFFVAVTGQSGSIGSYGLQLVDNTADNQRPTLLSTSPTDSSTGLPVDSNITLTFDEAIVRGTGMIRIATGTQSINIDVNDTSQVSIRDRTVTINPLIDLQHDTAYTLRYDSGALRDAAGNLAQPIAGNGSLDFRTAPRPGSNTDSWTLMVYMAADNNLEGYGVADVNEMEVVPLSDRVNLVVLFDRIAGESTASGNWTDTRVGRIVADTNSSTISSPLTSIGERNTGDPSTLTQFINQTVASNPADRYGLIVWDHGGGFLGTSDDSTSNDRLTLAEFRQAIDNATLDRFDLIGFDACLQGMVEQAWDLRRYADVMVASQDLEPGDGWDYTGIVRALADNPSLSSIDLATAIVQTYGESQIGRLGITLSVTDTDQMGALDSTMRDFVSTALSQPASTASQLLDCARRSAPIGPAQYGYRDLGTFMQNVADARLSTNLTNAALQVIDKLEAVVLNQTSNVQGTSGLSVYLPTNQIHRTYTATELSFVADTQWDSLLRFMLGQASTTAARTASSSADGRSISDVNAAADLLTDTATDPLLNLIGQYSTGSDSLGLLG